MRVHPCVYYVGMHHAGIRPIERHRWHYTYWQDTRDRPQVWIAGVTPLLSPARPRTVDTHGEPFRLPPLTIYRPCYAERERGETERTTKNFLYHYQPTNSEFTRETRSTPTWSSSTSWENASLHSDVHLDYRRTYLSCNRVLLVFKHCKTASIR